MARQLSGAFPARTSVTNHWLPAVVGGLVIGTVAGVFGPAVALVGVAVTLALLAGAWVIRTPARAVAVYAFLLPFDVYLSTTLRVTSTQAFQAFVLLVTAMGVLLAIGSAKRASQLPAGVAILGIGLVAYLVLSLSWSFNPATSARALARTLAAMMMGVIAAEAVRDHATLRRVLSAAALGAVITSLYGFAQFLRGGYDPLYRFFSPFYSEPFVARGAGFSVVATFANPNILAGYGAMVLPLVWALAADARAMRRVGWMAAAVLAGGAILLTFSKAGWLLVALLAALWMLARVTTGGRLAAMGGAGIAIGVTVLLFDRLLTTFTTLFPNAREASVESRLGLWRASLDAFVQSPLVGFGLDGFAPATAELRTGVLADLVRAHNIYLQTLVDLGIVGSLLFWAPLVVVYLSALKTLLSEPAARRYPLHLGLILSATAFFLFGLVETLNVSNNYVNTYWLVFGLLAASTAGRARAAGCAGHDS